MQMYIKSVESAYTESISPRYRANIEIICDSFAEIDHLRKFGHDGNSHDFLSFINAINRQKFMDVANKGKSKIIFMLKDNDPEIREIAQGFAKFMTSSEE